LPPTLGTFLLYLVKDYVDQLPHEMAVKDGLFSPCIVCSPAVLPVFADNSVEREAMWIRFKLREPLAVKVLIGGLNVVLSKSVVETAAT
jgi:hypothetical protein